MYNDLIEAALEARNFAYAPYSGFPVGSSVMMEDGTIFTGCNVENASFGATNCAERTAMFTAIAKGHQKMKALAVVGDLNTYTYPCGICRQVMVEFAENPQIPIIIIKSKEEFLVKTLEELLPGAFTKGDLETKEGAKYV
ncbi:MAG: cytidine deaminase [Clostridium sp.]|nr:cytidine deaminase [Clostridium sp.]